MGTEVNLDIIFYSVNKGFMGWYILVDKINKIMKVIITLFFRIYFS